LTDQPTPPHLLQAPFRFARTFIFGGLAAGAGLGLIVIIGRLVRSLQGERGAAEGVRKQQ